MIKTIYAAAALLALSVPAHALTYNVDRTVADGMVTGTIETDGTIGTLTAANITGFELLLTAPNLKGSVPSFLLSSGISGHVVKVFGTTLSATSSALVFNFDGGLRGSNAVSFSSANLDADYYYCLSATINCSAGAPNGVAEIIGKTDANAPAQVVTALQGPTEFATVSAVPLPAALPMLAAAFGVFGFMRRRRSAA